MKGDAAFPSIDDPTWTRICNAEIPGFEELRSNIERELQAGRSVSRLNAEGRKVQLSLKDLPWPKTKPSSS